MGDVVAHGCPLGEATEEEKAENYLRSQEKNASAGDSCVPSLESLYLCACASALALSECQPLGGWFCWG
jgi:hypothetical protein